MCSSKKTLHAFMANHSSYMAQLSYLGNRTTLGTTKGFVPFSISLCIAARKSDMNGYSAGCVGWPDHSISTRHLRSRRSRIDIALMVAMIAIFTPLALLSFLFVVQAFRQAATASGRPTSHPAE